MTETTIITTQIRCDADDFNIRREFCGVQDKRLNDLRQFTSCIIDIQTHGAKDPFEKVTWVISHDDEAVRSFVVKRIQAWAQTTQLAVTMHAEDLAFHQQAFSDISSCSTDGKGQQLGSSVKSSPSPPKSSVPMLFNKSSKTPLHDHHYSSIPNAALVPQTDLQPRHQQRRRRNSSTSNSGAQRPALFGKPSDYFLSRNHEYQRSLHSPLSTPMTKIKAHDTNSVLKENGFSLIKPHQTHLEKDYAFSKVDANNIANQENNRNDLENDDQNLEEEAKWANLLSDTSDFESDCQPLMADIILISQLRDVLINSHLSPNDDIDYIQSQLPATLSITGQEQKKTLNNQTIWFYRLVLNTKIILSNGLHQSRQDAQRIAYKKMLELMTNKQGVEPKIIANGRCKVVLRKSPPPKQLNETTMNESMMNKTMDAY